MEREDEEDLDYVTLAKAGGRKDLLIFKEFSKSSVNDKPTPYPWVDWFDHIHPVVPGEAQGTAAPYRPSNLLTWKIKEEQKLQQQQRSVTRLPKMRQRGLTYPPPPPPLNKPKQRQKLPTIVGDPVNMKELLSMDYQKAWVRLNCQRIADEKRKIKEKKQLQEIKLQQHSMKRRQVNFIDREKQTKERFIMKRFMNIPPKLKLPPLANASKQ